MGKCFPIFLIVVGVFILLIAGVLTIGFNFIVKTSIPLAMKFLPLNQSMQIWIEIPLQAHVTATLTNAWASSDVGNQTLGLGEIGFTVRMDEWGDGDEVFPILWIEEKAAIDEVMRYFLLLSDGPINYIKFVVGIAGVVFILLGFIAGVIRLTTK